MTYLVTKPFTDISDQAHADGFKELEADSFAEFARAILLGLGAILLAGAGTYIIFSGLAASLMALAS